MPGVAEARPFVTHHNSLDYAFHLRISLELYLKRLSVGGFDAVYEIGRNFRNEGISFKHNPEYTMLEVYSAYGTYDTMATLTRDLIQEGAQNVRGSLQVDLIDGSSYALSGEWASIASRRGCRATAPIPRPPGSPC